MRSLPSTAAAALALLSLTCLAPAAPAAPVVFSGTISYGGTQTADSLYVVAIRESDDLLFAIDRIPVSAPPWAYPFSLPFDNTGETSIGVYALLDVDGSGVAWDVGTLPDSVATEGDVIGWYDGQQEPVYLSPATSLPGLDFGMPTGEIRGDVTMIPGQTIAAIIATPDVNGDSNGEVETLLLASGPYALVGVYPGTWYVRGLSFLGEVCYGDPNCVSPTPILLGEGDVRTGIDVDFSPLPVGMETWGHIKSRYR